MIPNYPVLKLQNSYFSSHKFSSVQFSRSVVSDSLQPQELQHARPPCPSRQWCHPAISSSVVPFSSCPQSLPASESFPMSQLFTWGAKVLEFQLRIIPSKEIPGLISFRMDWLDLLAVQRTLKSLLQYHSSKASILWRSAFFTVVYQNSNKGQISDLPWNSRLSSCSHHTLIFMHLLKYKLDS